MRNNDGNDAQLSCINCITLYKLFPNIGSLNIIEFKKYMRNYKHDDIWKTVLFLFKDSSFI